MKRKTERGKTKVKLQNNLDSNTDLSQASIHTRPMNQTVKFDLSLRLLLQVFSVFNIISILLEAELWAQYIPGVYAYACSGTRCYHTNPGFWIQAGAGYYNAFVLGIHYILPLVRNGSVAGDIAIIPWLAVAMIVLPPKRSVKGALNVFFGFTLALTSWVLLLDSGEFFIHVTDFQIEYSIVPWFTNADLFLISCMCLVALHSREIAKLLTRCLSQSSIGDATLDGR